MDQIDTKVFTLIALATLAGIEILKGFFPKLISGKEQQLAIVLPILFTVGAKAAGWFHSTDWVNALLWALGDGATAGVAHDKLLDPVKKLLSGFLSKKPPSQ